MFLYIIQLLKETDGDEQLLFQTAYFWKYNEIKDCVIDVFKYKRLAVIPEYVEAYIYYLQKEEEVKQEEVPVQHHKAWHSIFKKKVPKK
jgi:hypothetical protein